MGLRGGARRPQDLGERGRTHLRVPPLTWLEAPSACTRGRARPKPGCTLREPLGGEAAPGVQEVDRGDPGRICRRLERESLERRRTQKSLIQFPGCRSHCCAPLPPCCALSHSSSAE